MHHLANASTSASVSVGNLLIAITNGKPNDWTVSTCFCKLHAPVNKASTFSSKCVISNSASSFGLRYLR